MFAAPMPIISWFGSTSSPRRAAKLVEVAIVSVSDTSVMPTAASSMGATSRDAGPGQRRARQPLGQRADASTPVARSNRPVTTVAPTTATSTAGIFVVTAAGRAGRPASPARATSAVGVGRVELRRRTPATSSTKPSASVENPNSFGQLADDDGDRQAVHVADLHLLGEQVGDEARACRGRGRSRSAPTITAIIPASAIAVPGSSPATTSGTIAAKISGETDESGPSTRTRDGPNERVADEAGDRRVQAGDRRAARRARRTPCPAARGSPRARAGDQVETQPRRLVGAQQPSPGTHPASPRV